MRKNQAHSYTVHDYMGKNIIGKPCHIYELRDNGKVVYKMNNLILKNGTENQDGIKMFYERAERMMDASAQEMAS